MSSATREPPRDTPTDLAAGEADVADRPADAERLLDRDTQVEGLTYLGDYPDLRSYLRAQLEDHVSAACGWILDCLDYAAVQRRFERDGSRLLCEAGAVYALARPHVTA